MWVVRHRGRGGVHWNGTGKYCLQVRTKLCHEVRELSTQKCRRVFSLIADGTRIIAWREDSVGSIKRRKTHSELAYPWNHPCNSEGKTAACLRHYHRSEHPLLIGNSVCSEILCSVQEGSKYIFWFDNSKDIWGIMGCSAFDMSFKPGLEAKEVAF